MQASRSVSVLQVCAAVFAIVLLTYSTVLQYDFGALDDYSFLRNAISGNSGTKALLISAGRPLNALLLDTGFSVAGTLHGLYWLRLVTLIGLTLLACSIFWLANNHGFSRPISMLMGTGTILLPSFQVYAVWAQHFTTPYAGLAALGSIHLISVADLRKVRSLLITLTSATILLVTALLIYQPIAMLFASGGAVALLSSRRRGRQWDWVVAAMLVYVLSMAVAYFAFKLGQHAYPLGGDRYGLVEDGYGKVIWFLKEPMVNAASFGVVPGNVGAAIVLLILLTIGFCHHVRHLSLGQKFLLGVLVVACGIASYLPNLATGENWASYRSLVALATLMFALFCVLVVQPVWDVVSSRVRSSARSLVRMLCAGLGTGFVVLLAVLAQGNVGTALVQPNVVEIDNLSRLLINASAQGAKLHKIIAVPSSWRDSGAKPLAYDEFGLASSVQNYYVAPLVDVVRRSIGVLPDAEIHVVAPGELKEVADPGVLQVDFRQLVTAGSLRAALLGN